MNIIEQEQLKNDVETKVGVLELAVKSGKVHEDEAEELIELFRDYEENGTTVQELKLLNEDIHLALNSVTK